MIRNVESGDFQCMADIYNHYVEKTTFTFEIEPVSLEVMEQRVLNVTEKHTWIVYVDDTSNLLVGFAYASTFKPRGAYQWTVETSVYVRHNWEGRGVGTALYECLFTTLSTQNYKSAIAIIPSRNESSLVFHRKFGFKEVGRLHQVGFKFGQWLDTTYMQKMLDGK